MPLRNEVFVEVTKIQVELDKVVLKFTQVLPKENALEADTHTMAQLLYLQGIRRVDS